MISDLALVSRPLQPSSVEPECITKPDSSSVPVSFVSAAAMPSRADHSIHTANFSQAARGLNCHITFDLNVFFFFLVLFSFPFVLDALIALDHSFLFYVCRGS